MSPTKPKSLAQRNTELIRKRRKMEAGMRRMTQVGANIDDMRNSARWQKLRSIVRGREPICRDPFGTHSETGIVTPTREIHHVVAAADDPHRFFDMDNLVGLCSRCHAMIEHRERKGYDTADLFKGKSHV